MQNLPNIFDYYGEDEFLAQTREKDDSINKKTVASVNQHRSFSTNTTHLLPIHSFKESYYEKKPSQKDDKANDLLKLKTIFESDNINMDTRRKSQSDIQFSAANNNINENINPRFSIEEVTTKSIASNLQANIKDPYQILEDESLIKEKLPEYKSDSFISAVNKSKDFEIKYRPFYIENSDEVKETLVDASEKILCFAISKKNIAIGTSNSGVIFFDTQTKIRRVLKIEVGMQVTAMDISYDDEVLVLAFSNGTLSFFEIFTLKLLKSFNKIHLYPVMSVKFYHSTGNSLKESRLLTSDTQENVNKITFEKGILGYDADPQLLISEWGQFFQIELLNPSCIKDGIKLVALASMRQIVIVTLEPKPKKLMALHRPQYINERSLPSISWNDLQNDNVSKPVQQFLAVLWGTVIMLIKIEEDNSGNIIHNIHSHYKLETSAIFCCFLNNEQILIIENCEEIIENSFLISISEFAVSKEENLNESVFLNEEFSPLINYSQIKKVHLPFNKPISFHTYLKDSNSMLIPCKIGNFLRSSLKNKLFYCREGEKLIEIGFYSTQKFFENLLKQKDFNAFFYFILQIYEGKTTYLLEEPEKKPETVQTLLKNATVEYFNFLLQQSEEEFTKGTENLLQIIIQTENFKLLFQETIEIFEKNSKEPIFMQILENFILDKKISFIPNKNLRSIISHFQKQGKFHIIESLILSLDYNQTDICPIITLCLEFHLLKALIYVSTVFSDDFMTPLIKIFSLHEEEQRKKNLQVSEEEKKEKELKFDENKNFLNYGEKCLAYLDLCFNKKLINKQVFPEDKFGLMLQQLILWIFEPENMQKLIIINPKYFFKIVLHLFRKENKEILRANCKFEDIKVNNSIEELNEVSAIERENSVLKVQNMLILSLIQSCYRHKNIKQIEPWLSLFIGEIINLNCGYYVSPIRALDAMKILLENCDLLNFIEISIEDNVNMNLSLDQEELLKSEFLINLLKYLEGKVEENLIEKVIALQEVSFYCKFNAEIQLSKKNYQKTFELYLKAKNKLFQKEVLDFLYVLMKKLYRKKDPAIQQINELILLNLPFLVAIDTAKTHELISNYNPSAEKTVIKYLSAYPELQKQYLEKVLKGREAGQTIDEELLLIHIDLLCKNNYETELLENLRNWEYPLDESLKLCKKYKMNEAIAYLLERTGASEEALNLYFEMIKEETDICFRENMLLSRPLNKINHIIDLLLNLCKKHWAFDNRGQEWLRFLDFIQRWVGYGGKKTEDQTDFQNFKKNVFSNVFSEFSTNVSLNILASVINGKYKSLSMKYVKDSFLILFSNNSYEKNIIFNANHLVKQEILQRNESFLSQNKKGTCIKNNCMKCGQEIKEGAVLLFCGHYFHIGCFINNKCPLCENKLIYQVERLLDNKRHIIDKANPNKFMIEQNNFKKKEDLTDLIEESTLIIIKNATLNNNRKIKKKSSINLLRNFEKVKYDELATLRLLEKQYNDF